MAKAENASVIDQFLHAIEPYSAREASALTGLAFSTICRLRRKHPIGSAYTHRVITQFLNGEEPHKQDRMATLIRRVEMLEARVVELENRGKDR